MGNPFGFATFASSACKVYEIVLEVGRSWLNSQPQVMIKSNYPLRLLTAMTCALWLRDFEVPILFAGKTAARNRLR